MSSSGHGSGAILSREELTSSQAHAAKLADTETSHMAIDKMEIIRRINAANRPFREIINKCDVLIEGHQDMKYRTKRAKNLHGNQAEMGNVRKLNCYIFD